MYARNIASSSALHRCPATPCLLHHCLLCQRLPLLHLCPLLPNEVRLLPHVCNNFAPNRASTPSSPRCCRLCNMLGDVASDTTFASATLPSPLHLRHLLIAVYRTCTYHQCFHIIDSSRAPRTRLWHPLFICDHDEVWLLLLALD
ncbi:hypothetical protein B296_00011480 [Ensete ventricosum]|uniref:Uncharacterized protein n=1 Tax=Ensete ventricosum TaxID=4639 RepID=A0A427A9K7_ENSVE|nr:hypothetical protein B296_00011480 [Ensete ventricosum]